MTVEELRNILRKCWISDRPEHFPSHVEHTYGIRLQFQSNDMGKVSIQDFTIIDEAKFIWFILRWL